MSPLRALLVIAFAATSCSKGASSLGGRDEDVGMLILGVSKSGCASDLDISDDDLTFDVDIGHAMHLAIVVENRLDVAITPTGLSARWECSTLGFEELLAPLFLPSITPGTHPFCLNRTAHLDPTFGLTNFSIEGASIPAHARGVVRAEAIPTNVGDAIDDVLVNAVFADTCCRAPSTSCDGSNSSAPGCQEIDAFFRRVDPTRSVRSAAAGTASLDLLLFASYAALNGPYYDQVLGSHAPQFGAHYSMRLRGRLMATTASGGMVRSNDFGELIGLCKSCGLRESGASTRSPIDRPECMR
jgi:hypothetical protein